MSRRRLRPRWRPPSGPGGGGGGRRSRKSGRGRRRRRRRRRRAAAAGGAGEFKAHRGGGEAGRRREGRERRAGGGLGARRPRRPARSPKFPRSPRRRRAGAGTALRAALAPRDPRPPRPPRVPAATRRRPGAAPRQVRSGAGSAAASYFVVGAAGPRGRRAVPAVIVCALAARAGDAERRGGAAGGRASPRGRGLRRPGPEAGGARGGMGCWRGGAERALRAASPTPGAGEPGGAVLSHPVRRQPLAGWAGVGAAPLAVWAKAALPGRPQGGRQAPCCPRCARVPAAGAVGPDTPKPELGPVSGSFFFFGAVSNPVTRRWGLTPS